MQLHALSFGALGPFPGEHVIDFDALGGSALFLIDGPTGAGKSTIIDAIAFALYGSVAGQATDRQRLRSDYAAADAPSYAELDFSTSFGRFRVRRTPEFARTKLRGTGTTTAPASVSLLRSVGPEGWEQVSRRAGEVDAEIARIVGLTRAQFLQTVVLPQGEFAAFLSAESADRLAVLERIFATDLYSRVEEVLDAERRAAVAEREAADEVLARSVRHLTSRLSDEEAVAVEPDSATLAEDLQALLEDVAGRLAADERAVEACEASEGEVARRVRALEAVLAARERVAAAREARDAAREQERAAREAVDGDLLAGLGVHRSVDEPGFADEALAVLDRTVGSLAAAREDEEQLPREVGEAERDERALVALESRVRALEEERDAGLPARLHELSGALERHVRAAEDAAHEAAARQQGLVQERLDGMAAELAESLEDGRPCPVCGAADHPHPAEHRGEPVTAEAVAAATQARDRAEARSRELLDERAALRALAEQAGGGGPSEGEAPEAPESSVTEIARAASALRTRIAEVAAELPQARAEQAATTTRLAALREAIAARRDRLVAATQGQGSVADRIAVLADARRAVAAVGRCAETVRQREEALDEAVAEAARHQADPEARFGESGDDDAAVTAALAEQRARHAQATAALRSATSARDASRALLADLRSRVAAVHDARQARQDCWERTADVMAVAAIVRGATGNRLAQPLSAYVVQTMFDEILEAANRRLRVMLDGRFALQSTEERTGRRLTGQGLGLQVLDRRTDTVRRTSTLSGGETFCASLALALGLADTVRAHAGGIDIGMLLIDEGFGSLDGERLDEVMAELLRLRADGRTVGVISHVAEMKRSILERIDVRPGGGREGSTLEVSWMT